MLTPVWKWFQERWPFSEVVHLSLDEKITGGASYFYTMGSSLLILFILQAVTGLMQVFFYVPSIDHAYNSISYLRTEVPFGWLIHGLHYWGGNVIIVVLALHMLRVFTWGAYKTPRELTWLAGVFLALTLMAFSFTGGPLHWDQRGYWAGEVGTSIAGTTPFAGNLAVRILRGGDSMGQLTITRFFTAHTLLLPAALLGLFGFHFIAFRRFGNVGPWDRLKRRYSGPFWPDQAIKDVVVGSLIFYLLIALTVFLPPYYSGPADPLDTTYVPKPEWNFLFLYEALKYFQGPLEPVGAVGVPGLIVTLLIMLPFVDRGPERNPLRRPVAMAVGLIFIGALGGLTIKGYLSEGFAVTGADIQAPSGQETSSQPAPAGEDVKKTPDVRQETESGASQDRQSVEKGEQLFESRGCRGCHKVNGAGGTTGPNLSQEQTQQRDREWLIQQIRNPKSHNPGTIMPASPDLTESEVNALVNYIKGPGIDQAQAAPVEEKTPAPGEKEDAAPEPGREKTEKTGPFGKPAEERPERKPGEAAKTIGSAEHGAGLFRIHCISCHGEQGKGGIPNPGSARGRVPALNPIDEDEFSRDPLEFARNIDLFIQHGSTPAGPDPSLSMPAFGDTHTLTQQEIANIEAYILKLNGVDRAKLIDPGMQPRTFFWIVTALYIALILFQGGIRMRRNIP
jgi:ubiquinol-cytochrome c reductase cytochrome b subunit